jgi:enoyl-CoA hydratase/carnithine racemase
LEGSVVDLKREGDVFVLGMDAGENRFHPDMVAAWHAALDEVEAAAGPKALVTTGAGKFYSNGLDVEYMGTSGVDPAGYVASVLGVMARVLVMPCPTAAAANGHAFGAGAQIILCHDYRVMRSERGFFCMPEVDLKLPLHPGMTAIIQARVPGETAHQMIVTGARYGGAQALERGIVDAIASESEVVARAIEWVAPLAAKADPVMASLKRGMYPRVLAALAGGA